jgi:hypothetical protein
MKKAIIAITVAAASTVGFSATAAAGGGNSDMGTLHPGHVGYVKTEGSGGGVPAAHFHNPDCFEPGVSVCYPTGPGGWGGAVSAAAPSGGIPGAHG